MKIALSDSPLQSWAWRDPAGHEMCSLGRELTGGRVYAARLAAAWLRWQPLHSHCEGTGAGAAAPRGGVLRAPVRPDCGPPHPQQVLLRAAKTLLLRFELPRDEQPLLQHQHDLSLTCRYPQPSRSASSQSRNFYTACWSPQDRAGASPGI